MPSGAGDIALGDPGLLCDRLIPKPISKPVNKYPSLKVIDVSDDPIEVIRLIGECEFIFSSSLHGLIIADSFGIPNQWVEFDTIIYGNGWKFQDYYSVFPTESPKPIKLSETQDIKKLSEALAAAYKRQGIDSIKAQLFDAFPASQLRRQ